MIFLGNIALSWKDWVFSLKVRLQCLSLFTTPSLLLFWLKKSLSSCPGVDTAVVPLIWCWGEELGQLLDTSWSNASARWLLVNVLQSVSGLWVTAVLMESIGILCLHLVPRPHITWTSLGIWRKWHTGCWRHWDRPWLVMQLHGNVLQDSDTLLLFSYVAHFGSS